MTTVGRTAAKAPGDDWDGRPTLKTVDGAPGGQIKWLPAGGRVQVCDVEGDNHLVRGYVFRNGKKINLAGGRGKGAGKGGVRAGEKGKCDEGRIKDYQRGEEYEIRVCLATGDDDPDGYCNSSGSEVDDWPDPSREEGYCQELEDKQEKFDCVGGVDDFCTLMFETEAMFEESCREKWGEGEKATLTPPKKPKGWKSDKYYLTHRPDAGLPRDHAKRADEVHQPIEPLLRWLVWTALGACVLGIMMVGGNMAIRHKRSEAGAHAASLSWVLIACVIAGSGVAFAFISLLVDPL